MIARLVFALFTEMILVGVLISGSLRNAGRLGGFPSAPAPCPWTCTTAVPRNRAKVGPSWIVSVPAAPKEDGRGVTGAGLWTARHRRSRTALRAPPTDLGQPRKERAVAHTTHTAYDSPRSQAPSGTRSRNGRRRPLGARDQLDACGPLSQ